MVAKMHTLAPARARVVTPLLAHLAGEFADVIAQVWRAPYGDFYTLPAPRRHGAAIALAGLAREDLSDAELRRRLEFDRDPALALALVGELAPGFMKMLSKAGEQLWNRVDYVTLLDLFREPMANEVLRHTAVIEPRTFAPLAALPKALREAKIVRHGANTHAGRDLAGAFDMAVRMRRPGCEARLARRWAAGGSANDLYVRACQDLMPDEFRLPAPAPRLEAPFVRVASRRQLERMARDFRNCLSDHAGRIAQGHMAVYAWHAPVPVALALNWDAAGWRLAEAKGGGNEDLDEAQLRELVAILARYDVRTGPSVETLRNRLYRHADGDQDFYRPDATFEDRLELGDLWS